mmetsp:Transcript_20606/g.26057  ORF Transcript_20606/g.26057 Transcript_20606/m.26057 type:complete len:105 (+) Transcript_20606:435-749(+)
MFQFMYGTAENVNPVEFRVNDGYTLKTKLISTSSFGYARYKAGNNSLQSEVVPKGIVTFSDPASYNAQPNVWNVNSLIITCAVSLLTREGMDWTANGGEAFSLF